MKPLCLLLALTPLLRAEPLRITAVDRHGPPPYEDENRVYRLEGEGWERLKTGDALSIQRPGDYRTIGQLKVSGLREGCAEAHLEHRGETYPLKGDLALLQQLHPLPALPRTSALPSLSGFQLPAASPPPALAAPTAPSAHRESIFFLKEDASLSPGAKRKLKAWVEAWGTQGTWSLLCPEGVSPELAQDRCSALREELATLGVRQVKILPAPTEPAGEFDAVHLLREP